jgi:hypothetical protein
VTSTLIFARGSNMAMLRSALYVYGGGAFISTNPFIALGLTEAFLSNGDHPLYSVVKPGGRDFLVPSPWLVYVVLSALFTVVLLLVSVRLLRPQPESRRKQRGPAPQE